jgi:hypothetical protein
MVIRKKAEENPSEILKIKSKKNYKFEQYNKLIELSNQGKKSWNPETVLFRMKKENSKKHKHD